MFKTLANLFWPTSSSMKSRVSISQEKNLLHPFEARVLIEDAQTKTEFVTALNEIKGIHFPIPKSHTELFNRFKTYKGDWEKEKILEEVKKSLFVMKVSVKGTLCPQLEDPMKQLNKYFPNEPEEEKLSLLVLLQQETTVHPIGYFKNLLEKKILQDEFFLSSSHKNIEIKPFLHPDKSVSLESTWVLNRSRGNSLSSSPVAELIIASKWVNEGDSFKNFGVIQSVKILDSTS